MLALPHALCRRFEAPLKRSVRFTLSCTGASDGESFLSPPPPSLPSTGELPPSAGCGDGLPLRCAAWRAGLFRRCAVGDLEATASPGVTSPKPRNWGKTWQPGTHATPSVSGPAWGKIPVAGAPWGRLASPHLGGALQQALLRLRHASVRGIGIGHVGQRRARRLVPRRRRLGATRHHLVHGHHDTPTYMRVSFKRLPPVLAPQRSHPRPQTSAVGSVRGVLLSWRYAKRP